MVPVGDKQKRDAAVVAGGVACGGNSVTVTRLDMHAALDMTLGTAGCGWDLTIVAVI